MFVFKDCHGLFQMPRSLLPLPRHEEEARCVVGSIIYNVRVAQLEPYSVSLLCISQSARVVLILGHFSQIATHYAHLRFKPASVCVVQTFQKVLLGHEEIRPHRGLPDAQRVERERHYRVIAYASGLSQSFLQRLSAFLASACKKLACAYIESGISLIVLAGLAVLQYQGRI